MTAVTATGAGGSILFGMDVDYVIIGAGVAGTVLRHFLQSDSVVLLDPRPGQHKIGESIIPEHHQHPELRRLLPGLHALPTHSPKHGTTFICADSVASFPLPPHVVDLAMHIGREDMEKYLHEAWQIPIVRERVTGVDVDARVVTTNRSSYRARRQIIDCSGPAMVVATSLGEVSQLWPVWCRWAYFDITGIDDARFWQEIRRSGRDYRRYDAAHRRLLTNQEADDWRPSHTTILTQLRPGEWTWQIPLANRSLLSFGVVSRHGEVSEEALFEVVERTHSPQYELRRRSGEGSFDRVYVRNHFARVAKTPATMSYILVADACAFADPIYSVGTGLAVNKAIELADYLNDGGWSEAKCAQWTNDYRALLARAVAAFDLWYSGAVVRDDAAAAEAQRGFLVGSAFQVAVATRYGDVLIDAKGKTPFDESGAIDGAFSAVGTADRSDDVRALLELGPERVLDGWRLTGAGSLRSGVQLRWQSADLPELVMSVTSDPGVTRYYRRVGNISLSFMNLPDAPYPLEAPTVRLFDSVEARIRGREREWEALARR